MRTKVGSPFVIAGMEQAKAAGARTVAGFEANGGFLLGSDVTRDGKTLPALPTRDAMLPILATLAAARAAGLPLADLVSALDAGDMASDRFRTRRPRQAAPSSRGSGMRISGRLPPPIGSPDSIDEQDGIRIGLDGGRTIHFRASGNAPELRCYAEAKSAQDAQDLVRWGLAAAAAALAKA